MYAQIYLADVHILVPGKSYCCARVEDSYEQVYRYICVHVDIFGKSTSQYCCVRSDDSYEYVYDQNKCDSYEHIYNSYEFTHYVSYAYICIYMSVVMIDMKLDIHMCTRKYIYI